MDQLPEIMDENTVAPGRPAVIRVNDAFGEVSTASLTTEQKDYIVAGLRSGRSLAAVLRDDVGLPGYTRVSLERQRDAAFDDACVRARADGVAAVIDESLDFARASRNSKDRSIAAAKYADVVQKSAGLLAPKHFGPMIKFADADGNKLSISIVQYVAPKLVADAPKALPGPSSDA